MCTLQNVINLLKKVNPSIQKYVICLILSSGRKNCADMARSSRISPKPLYAYLANAKKHSSEIENILIDYAKETRVQGVKRSLVVDPTTFIKSYASSMENIGYDFAGCTKRTERCLVPVYVSVVDKNVKIPLMTDFWAQEKVIGERLYKTKIRIACKLISYCKGKGVYFDFVSLDGAFSKRDMFCYFKESNLDFSMRIAKNRCIITKNGKRMQLKHCPDLKLMRNSREKTIQAELDGETYFFTAQKRKRKSGGWETIFLVSNMDLSAKDQVAAYNLRWPQEEINRTTKQKFGSAQCQALKASKQKAHIMASFLAHTIIELSQNDKQKQSVDKVVNFIRRNHFDDLASLIEGRKKPSPVCNIDPIAKIFQNYAQALLRNIGQYYSLSR